MCRYKANLHIDLPQPAKVTLTVFNLNGQLVRTLAEQHYAAGFHSVIFDASDLASGIYFYRMEAGDDFVGARKMVRAR